MVSSGEPDILLGLIGAGIQASRAPAMHQREAAEHGLRCIYKLIDLQQLGLGVDALAELLTAAERMGFTGLNITHPCKQAVIPLLTELSDDAKAIGAVNTVLLRGGRRIGHNTDWSGFAESFRRGLSDAHTRPRCAGRRGRRGCRGSLCRSETWCRPAHDLRYRLRSIAGPGEGDLRTLRRGPRECQAPISWLPLRRQTG